MKYQIGVVNQEQLAIRLLPLKCPYSMCCFDAPAEQHLEIKHTFLADSWGRACEVFERWVIINYGPLYQQTKT